MGSTNRFRRPGSRKVAVRRTNVGLLILLVGAFGSGWVAFATAGAVTSVLAVGAHGLFGLGVLVLAPWKTMIIRRARSLRPWSVVLIVVVLAGLAAGFVQLLGGYGYRLGLSPIQVHVGATVALVPLVAWHVVRHPPMLPRRTDLSRRSLLRTAAFVGGSAAGTAALTGVAIAITGGARTGTGSRPLDPDAIPPTIWLLDRTPVLDPATYRIMVDGTALGVADLQPLTRTVAARLDCTSGWYADADWTGVPLPDLLDPARWAAARSVVVRSATGYVRTFPATAAPHLWLATGSQGVPLDAVHGAPVRLVAPGHRGFWWVKWVTSVELSDGPPWRQLTFPV